MEFVSDGDRLFAKVIEPWVTAPSGILGSGVPPSSGGAAQNIVLLHPTPLDHHFWLFLAPHMARYRLILPDLRGHGCSPLGFVRDALTIEQLGRDLIALVDTLEIDQAIFAGCSIGGYTLYELWRTAPGRMAAAIFANSKPQSDTAAERAKRDGWIAKHEAARLHGEIQPAPEFTEAMLAALLSAETHAHKPALVAATRAMIEQVRPEAIQAIQRGLGGRPDSQGTAASITVPTCVIAGEQDTSNTPFDLSALRTLLEQGGSRSEYHLVTQAGHYAPMEKPATVASVLDRFCQSLRV